VHRCSVRPVVRSSSYFPQFYMFPRASYFALACRSVCSAGDFIVSCEMIMGGRFGPQDACFRLTVSPSEGLKAN